jgi:diacylglycerol kinase family enzyme
MMFEARWPSAFFTIGASAGCIVVGAEGAGCGAVCAIAPVAMSVAIAVVAKRLRSIVLLLLVVACDLCLRPAEAGFPPWLRAAAGRLLLGHNASCPLWFRLAFHRLFNVLAKLTQRNLWPRRAFVSAVSPETSMRFLAILNRDGGTLRTLDLDAFEERARATLEAQGHELRVEQVAGEDVVDALGRAAKRRGVDVVLAGGGDGTISAAAAALMGTRRPLAVLPAGTMNLFARGLGIPLDLDAAVQAFARGRPHAVDVASANGRPFVHQFSIGLHPELVGRREQASYGSRLGKMRASATAALQTLRNPPSLSVKLEMGATEIIARTSSIGVSNNLFGEGHLPYADMPDKGELGIYVARTRRRSDFFRFALHMARGRWDANPQVEIHRSGEVELTILSSHRGMRAAIDGELCKLERRTELKSHAGALNVLLPPAE